MVHKLAIVAVIGLTGSAVRAVVQYQGQLSTAKELGITAVTPAVFSLNGSGTGQAIAFNQDGSLTDAGHPAAAGSFVSVYATGTGQLNPAGQAGSLALGTASTVVPVTATVGGIAAPVNYSGSAVNLLGGVSQVNVQIPPGVPAGPAQLILRQAGSTSQAGVTIYVK